MPSGRIFQPSISPTSRHLPASRARVRLACRTRRPAVDALSPGLEARDGFDEHRRRRCRADVFAAEAWEEPALDMSSSARKALR